jgi:hypothetical protein
MALARMFMQVFVGLSASAFATATNASCDAHSGSRADRTQQVISSGAALLQQKTEAHASQQAPREARVNSLSQFDNRYARAAKRLSGIGDTAPLNEAGYQQVAAACCHHEMTQYVGRVVVSLNHQVCDVPDMFGLVHWFDCDNDGRTYAALLAEVQKGTARPCPWLGSGNICPVKDDNCKNQYPPCPDTFPPDSLPGLTAPLSQTGYHKVAMRCCDTEIKDYILREITRQSFVICDQGALQGLIHWYDCTNDGQTYSKLVDEITHAHSGSPCPWLGVDGQACPARSHNCPIVGVGGLEGPDPPAHRRRTACR